MGETRLQEVFGALPIRGQVAFSNPAGKFKEKLKKQQLKILAPITGDLKYHLDPDEEILLSSRAISPFTFMEQLVTGWSIFYMKRCVLVLTNRRILHFPTSYRYRGRNSVAMIRFQDVAGVKAGRKIVFKYKNGVKETFYGVRNGKKFRTVLDSLRITSSASSSRGGRHHLCPKCAAALVRDRFTCPKCRLEFKSPGAAKLYSVFLPGGGYFYTRHPILGCFDALGELVLMVLVLLLALGTFLKTQDFLTPDPLAAVVLALVLLIEKLVTIYHSDHFVKEYIPVEKEFNRIPKTPPPARARMDAPIGDLEDERVTFK